eukprot:scaffold2048_cov318-Pavlova_lutheri.AAC.6
MGEEEEPPHPRGRTRRRPRRDTLASEFRGEERRVETASRMRMPTRRIDSLCADRPVPAILPPPILACLRARSSLSRRGGRPSDTVAPPAPLPSNRTRFSPILESVRRASSKGIRFPF